MLFKTFALLSRVHAVQLHSHCLDVRDKCLLAFYGSRWCQCRGSYPVFDDTLFSFLNQCVYWVNRSDGSVRKGAKQWLNAEPLISRDLPTLSFFSFPKLVFPGDLFLIRLKMQLVWLAMIKIIEIKIMANQTSATIFEHF